MSEDGRPSVTPFSISDILNREEGSQNSSSIWDSRHTCERPIVSVPYVVPPQFMQTSPSHPNLQPFSACTRYPCGSQQPIASSTMTSNDRNLEETSIHRSDNRSKDDGECVICQFVVRPSQAVGGL